MDTTLDIGYNSYFFSPGRRGLFDRRGAVLRRAAGHLVGGHDPGFDVLGGQVPLPLEGGRRGRPDHRNVEPHRVGVGLNRKLMSCSHGKELGSTC